MIQLWFFHLHVCSEPAPLYSSFKKGLLRRNTIGSLGAFPQRGVIETGGIVLEQVNSCVHTAPQVGRGEIGVSWAPETEYWLASDAGKICRQEEILDKEPFKHAKAMWTVSVSSSLSVYPSSQIWSMLGSEYWPWGLLWFPFFFLLMGQQEGWGDWFVLAPRFKELAWKERSWNHPLPSTELGRPTWQR